MGVKDREKVVEVRGSTDRGPGPRRRTRSVTNHSESLRSSRSVRPQWRESSPSGVGLEAPLLHPYVYEDPRGQGPFRCV